MFRDFHTTQNAQPSAKKKQPRSIIRVAPSTVKASARQKFNSPPAGASSLNARRSKGASREMTKTTLSHSEISPLAERMETGRAKLVEAIATCGRISATDADLVAAFYLKNKIAKLSISIGQFNIQHGAFLDQDVIERALAEARKS